MADYLLSVMTKEQGGWAHLTTEEVTMTAQANGEKLKRDIIRHCTEMFEGNEYMDDDYIDRVTNSIDMDVDNINVLDSVDAEVAKILHKHLDNDVIDIVSIDINEFIDIDITVDTRELKEELKENREENELSFKIVLDTMGIIMYEVNDSENILIGKVILSWLEG